MALSIFKNRYASDAKTISDKAFYTIIATTLLFGFLVNAVEVAFFFDYFASWNPVIFFAVYVVLLIAGVLINVISRKPLLSFIGYCMVVLPIGAMLSLVVPAYSFYTVRSAFIATALAAASMTLLAVVCPRFFYSMVRVVGLCLLVALIYQIIAIFAGFGINSLVDWLLVLLFCGYIGLDVSFARGRPKTVDNAIDSACGLYLDIINLFIRLLAVLADRN